MMIAHLEDEDGKLLTIITLIPKEFKTGSRGFHGQGQVAKDGKRYQINFQLVEIESQKGK